MIISKEATGPFTRAERILITVPVLIASILHSLAMTTAYIALPNMKGELSVSQDEISRPSWYRTPSGSARPAGSACASGAS